ncbi:MAG: Ig-like domain-containing protein [Bacteroidota bacterium]
MRKLLLLIVCFCCHHLLQAQVTLSVGSGAHFVVSGASQVVMDTGSFINNGTYTDSTGMFKASGGITFSGGGTTRINNLTVNNSQATNFSSTVSVYNTATLSAGTMNANNNLYIRSDNNTIANLVVAGVLNNHVRGIIARASTTSSTGCAPYTSTLALNISGPAMVYQWQSSPDSIAWSSIAGATAAAYTASVTVSAWYRCSLATNNSAYVQSTPGIKLTLSDTLPAITGTTTLCTGTTATLTAGSSGTWTSSNTTVATIGASSGVVTGVAAGTSFISYSSGAGCSATKTVTVSSAPPAITGTLKACPATTTTLANALAGGTWSSTNIAVAAIDVSTGVATGVVAGTTTISYAVSGSCYRAAVLTVNPTPNAIGGTLSVCTGNTALVTNSTSGGVSWTSSNTAVATVGSGSGLVTGVSLGTTTITYTVNTGCYRTATFTVNAGPAAITGASTVCAGSSTTLANAVSGGTWTSTYPGVAIVGSSSGIVTGVNSGTTTITYNVGGCRAYTSFTVSAIAAITGTPTLCIGSNTTLYNATGGGTWSSSDAAKAGVGSATGAVTGVSAGTAVITYILPSGCSRTVAVTVSATPVTMGGTPVVCPGTTTSLTNTASGGTWSGSNASIGTITSSTGVLTGVNAGTLHITYTIPGGCKAMAVATVNPLPASMGGTLNVCRDQSTIITNATSGGTWSSNNTAIATIGGATGIATGIAAGNTHITYTLPTGCYRAAAFTVKPLPAAIGGSLNVCTTTGTVLSNATSGGISWTSSNTGIATIGTSSGLLTGVSAGTTTITYTITTGCFTTAVATVHILPTAGTITGPSSVVAGSTATLSNPATGGVWSSSNAGIASVDTGGVVTGASGGSATISYSVSNPGCTVRAMKAISVMLSRAPGAVAQVAGNLQLYPNPTTGTFTIDAPEAGVLNIYTLDGKEVGKYPVARGATMITLPNELASGVYMGRYTGESINTTVVRLVYDR